MSATVEFKSFIEVVRGILNDLNKLTDEQLLALANKEAKFKYFDANAAKGEKKTPSITQEQIEKIVDTLKKCNSIEEAKSYLEGQKKTLTITKLQDIAKHINTPLLSKKKADIIKALVESTIGVRLRYESIQRT